MYKTIIPILIMTIAFSSCRPSYMRCPKNKRCVAIPVTNKESLCLQEVKNSEKELTTQQL